MSRVPTVDGEYIEFKCFVTTQKNILHCDESEKLFRILTTL